MLSRRRRPLHLHTRHELDRREAQQAGQFVRRLRQFADRVAVELREERVARGRQRMLEPALRLDDAAAPVAMFVRKAANERKIVLGFADNRAG